MNTLLVLTWCLLSVGAALIAFEIFFDEDAGGKGAYSETGAWGGDIMYIFFIYEVGGNVPLYLPNLNMSLYVGLTLPFLLLILCYWTSMAGFTVAGTQ